MVEFYFEMKDFNSEGESEKTYPRFSSDNAYLKVRENRRRDRGKSSGPA